MIQLIHSGYRYMLRPLPTLYKKASIKKHVYQFAKLEAPFSEHTEMNTLQARCASKEKPVK